MAIKLFLVVILAICLSSAVNGEVDCSSFNSDSTTCTCGEGQTSASILIDCNNKKLQKIPNLIFNTSYSVTLDMRKNKGIVNIPDYAFSNIKRLHVVRLDDNSIDTITGDAFKGADELKELYLNGNLLTSFPAAALNGLNKLEKVEVRKNEIKSPLNLQQANLTSLRHLSLSENGITELTRGEFTKLPTLRGLELNDNQLGQDGLDRDVFDGVHRLEALSLSGNQLQDDDLDSIRLMTNLQILDLSRNNIEKLDARLFNRFLKMVQFFVSGNYLKEIDVQLLNGLTSIADLDFSKNRISVLDEDVFKDQNEATSLNMNSNLLVAVPTESLKPLKKLKNLKLSGNRFASLSANSFAMLPNLTSLTLDDNFITQVDDDAFSGLMYLQTLSLAGNRLTIVPPLYGLDGLKELVLRKNYINIVRRGAFKGLGIEKLDLSENKINSSLKTSLPREAFSGLGSSLVSLDLHDNELTTLHFCVFENLKKLSTFDYTENSLKCDCNLGWLHDKNYELGTWRNPSCDDLASVIKACPADVAYNCSDPSTPAGSAQYGGLESTSNMTTVIVLSCVCGVAALAVIIGFLAIACQKSKKRKYYSGESELYNSSRELANDTDNATGIEETKI